MPSGGARAHSGPRRDPSAVRHGGSDDPVDLGDGWTELPHAGRRKRAPAWPFPDQPDADVLRLWAKEWKRPQALMWEHRGQQLEVALYCLRVHQALTDPGKITLGTLIRQQQEALGLSAPGLHRNRWVIGNPVPRQSRPTSSSAEPAAAAAGSGAASMRGRLSVVPDAADGD